MNYRNEEPHQSTQKAGWMSTPLSQQGVPVWVVYALAVIGLVYILNPGAGVFELLPDNLPFVGNLDEGVAALMLWGGLVEFFEGRRRARPN